MLLLQYNNNQNHHQFDLLELEHKEGMMQQ